MKKLFPLFILIVDPSEIKPPSEGSILVIVIVSLVGILILFFASYKKK